MKFTHPAGIVTRALNSEELMTLAKNRAPDPAAFDEYPPLFISAEATNNRLDAYYTRMMPSSLKNYAAEAAEGVSFQDSHQTDALTFMMGRTLTGEYIGAQGDGKARVLVNLYTIQNLPETGNFISKYRTGIARDVSIGFYGGTFICSICGLDMMSWDCWHYPGREVEVEEENTDGSKTVRKVIATADVEDAHLAELSAVYKGATPGAVIVKALRDVEEGRMKPDVARFLEMRYRFLDLNLSRTRRSFPGHSTEENRDMATHRREGEATTTTDANAGTTTTTTDGTNAGTNGAGANAGASAGEGAGATTTGTTDGGGTTTDSPGTTDQAATEAAGATADDARMLPQLRTLLTARGLEASILPTSVRVLDLALDGLTYRRDLIEEALKEGVRAHGADNFKREQYEKTLRSAEIETIKLMRDDWARQAKANLQGGRATSDETELPPSEQDRAVRVEVPPQAFM
jgi:hypothetical protein